MKNGFITNYCTRDYQCVKSLKLKFYYAKNKISSITHKI